MNFVPPPYADDVQGDFGPYNVDEIIRARISLLHSVQRENNPAWRSVKHKLGIHPNGHRLRIQDNFQPVWLPPQLPKLWSAPVVLHDPSGASDRAPGRTEPGYGAGERINNQQGERFQQGERNQQGEKFQQQEESSHQQAGKNQQQGERPQQRPGTREENRESPNSDSIVVESQLLNPITIESPAPANSVLTNPPTTKWFNSPPGTSSGMGGEGDANYFKFAFGESEEEEEDSDSSGDADLSDDPTVHHQKRKRGKSMDDDHSQSSSKRMKDDIAKQQIYIVIFQCDMCNFFHRSEDRVQQHLQQSGHYSGSKYLGMIVGEEQVAELYLVFLCRSAMLVEPDNVFKEKVASCPICHNVFVNLTRCLQHCMAVHQEQGVYSFREVIYSTNFDFMKDVNECTDCGENFADKDLKAHITKTKHMELALGEKTSRSSMVFLCPFCQGTNFNYLGFKSHVFEKHARETESLSVTLSAMCCIIGESQPPLQMLPQEPKIPAKHIISSNYPNSKFRDKCGYNPGNRKVESLPLKRLQLPLVLKLKSCAKVSQSKLHKKLHNRQRRLDHQAKKVATKKRQRKERRKARKESERE